MLDEIPAMIQSSTIEVAMVWQLTDTSELIALKAANSKGARKVGLSAIITDADKLNKKVPGLHFAFPLDEMCKSAVDILISKIENPNVIAAGLALPIPLPA
jgi:DNA-binding LacI/PurR family transcriptional regulator